jgi:hypothetical protein
MSKLTTEGLFDDEKIKSRMTLRKMPHHFHYVYECDTPEGAKQFKHKVTDWEASMLYWNCRTSHGPRWESPFRQRLETDFREKDLVFMMGTQHRFPDQWLIIGLVYPPRPKPAAQLERPVTRQAELSLFD